MKIIKKTFLFLLCCNFAFAFHDVEVANEEIASELYRSWGADVIGMTKCQKEAEIFWIVDSNI